VAAESSDAATKAPAKGATKDLSRREKEALQVQQAKERYAKLHAEGKTDEAKADLARLAIIREKREAEAARKQAEAEEKSEQEKSKAEQLEREAKLRAAAAGRGGKGGKKKK
jgi:Casein kinase substrate phosphoprotein PP28